MNRLHIHLRGGGRGWGLGRAAQGAHARKGLFFLGGVRILNKGYCFLPGAFSSSCPGDGVF